MRKDGKDKEFDPPRRASEGIIAPPRRGSFLFARRNSRDRLPLAASPDTSRRAMRNSAEFVAGESVKKLEILKSQINEQCAAIDIALSAEDSQVSDDFSLLTLMLVRYTEVNKFIIAERENLDDVTKNDLDMFVYQQQPPQLVYLYVKVMFTVDQFPFRTIKVDRLSSRLSLSEQVSTDGLKLEWLRTLIDSYTPGMANTLIYIATLLELSRENTSQGVLFREDSLSNKLSLCYAKARSSDYLARFVNEVIQCMRTQPNWPLGYNIDDESAPIDEKTMENFRAMMAAISKIITQVVCDPTISSILSLRYDLTMQSQDYDEHIASQAAISLFWLRLFIPLFRNQKFEPLELPVIKRVSTLLTKASSGMEFMISDGQPLHAFFNGILRNSLFVDFRRCFGRLTEKKSHTMIFDFNDKKWKIFRPVLLSAVDCGSRLNQLSHM